MEINTNVIKKVIEKDNIYVEFQPIVSVAARRMIGVEALSRGEFSGETISPYYLFQYAKDLGLTFELDKICREKALEAFSEEQIVPMLFLNFETDVLNNIEPGEDEIISEADKYNIPYENIVIEINKNRVYDNRNLLKFSEFYRQKGFLIALDNVGAGHSNLNRITFVKPDIVKIDRALVQEIDKSPYSREVFKSIINLSKKIGALTIAEGAETLEEVVTCMLCGVDLFQGFYFAKPEPFDELFSIDIDEKLENAAQGLKASMKLKQEIDGNYKKGYMTLIDELVTKLADVSAAQFEDILWQYVTDNNAVECVFLLDNNGVQISDTIILEDTLNERHSVLFAPAIKGDKHEIKNYYYAVKENIENPFISDWYISNATGKTCKTLSSKFNDKDGNIVIVCIDLKFNK